MGRIRISKFLIFIYSFVLLSFVILAVVGNRAVTTLSESAIKTDRYILIIDPGHGGEDGGAISCSGVLESKLNLEISIRLNELFRFLGYQTIMTRSDDAALSTQGNTIAQRKKSDLMNRVDLINKTKGGILLSIHQNHFADSRYSGAQAFYAQSTMSKELASYLQNTMNKALFSVGKRNAKMASHVYLMKHINAPGILIECGFLSNPDEERKLRDSNYQKILCTTIAAGVSQFLTTEK